MVKESDFHLIRGTPATHEELSKEGGTIKRHYCLKCGSDLWAQTDLGLLSVSVGTFDDPGVFHSTKKVFVYDAPDWARVPNELAQQQDLLSKESRNDEDNTDHEFESIDLVTCFQTLEHVQDPVFFGIKLRDIQKGILIVSVPYMWPTNKAPNEHKHDPISMELIHNWLGTHSLEEIIVAEERGTRRWIGVYGEPANKAFSRTNHSLLEKLSKGMRV